MYPTFVNLLPRPASGIRVILFSCGFGFDVSQVDGHNINNLISALKIKSIKKPKIIIANTVKGKGVSFMENNNLWHYKNPDLNELKDSLKELNKKYA